MPDRTFRHRRRWARRRARSMCLGLVGAILAGPAVAAAPQQPPPQTLKELSVTLNHTLGRPFSFQFTPDGQTLLYLRSGARDRDTKLYAFDVASKQERLVASAEDLLGGDTQETAAERAARERKRIKLAGLSSYTLSAGGDKILISNSGKVFIHDLKKNRTDRIQLPEGELANPKLSPDGDKLAFVLDYNLYVARLSPPGKKGIKTRVTRLTRGGTVTASFGVAEFVAQEEMSRHDGFWWSPDSKRILYQATDQSELDRFTIADAAAPEKAAEVFPYPRAGRNNAEVRLFIVNTSGRRRTEVRWNRSTWAYVAKVRWPRNRHPTVLLQARDQRSQAYMRIDPKSGATTAMHREEDAAWLNIHDSTPWWLEDGSYLWASEADSAWALYRYTPRDKRAGSKRRAVIVGPDAGFNSLLHVDEAGGWVWFSGGLDPTQNHIYRAPLGGGPVEQITEQDGYNDATVSPDGTNVVIAHASLSKLPEAHLYSATGPIKESKTKIEIPQTSSNPKRLPLVERVPPEKAGGFHAAIIRPRRFDPNTKYPVILYVYGGPGVQVVRSIAHNYMVQQWMADHGFVVVSIDGRGTPRRGRDHERALRLRFADVPLEDQIKGLTALGDSYPQLDLDRVGIYGWSFGGYMAALGVLRRPDIFKVAVAGAPVVDWTYYDTHYTERYLGLPQHEAEAYRQANLLTYAKHLKSPLMLVHGIADDNVYFAHSLLLADALFKAGKKFELVPLVGLTHQVSDPKVREVLYDRIVQFMGAVLW